MANPTPKPTPPLPPAHTDVPRPDRIPGGERPDRIEPPTPDLPDDDDDKTDRPGQPKPPPHR